MTMIDLSQLCRAISLQTPEALFVSGVSIDTRKLAPQELFVAIKGDNFDGHDFIREAERLGASAVLCTTPVSGLQIPQILCQDSMALLAKLAGAHRKTLSCPIIALTGSNGKTTVKEMIASILPKPAFATKGNLNNHIGVPLSVLALRKEHRHAVFELGANHQGEIAFTAEIVRPDVALINNIGPAHLLGFGSIEGVARAKGEIYQALSENGIAIINDDDDFAHFWDASLKDKTQLRFSSKKTSDFYLTELFFDHRDFASFCLHLPDGQKAMIKLQVPGQHNVQNALAASACCFSLGLDLKQIIQGLNQFRGVAGRMTLKKGLFDSTIIDDSYNANLRSTTAALTVLAKQKGKRIFVFGDMGELGEHSLSQHEAVGKAARELGIDSMLTVGQNSRLALQAFAGKGQHFDNKAALTEALKGMLDRETTVLIKGSRSSAMEEIANRLLESVEMTR